MGVLPRDFYARDTVIVAKELLGKNLVRRIDNNIVSGIITETEAYRYKDDPASHAFVGMTERNKAMFGEVGRAYVYFTYGMYHCFNVVARGPKFEAGAVLIRVLKPEKGISEMMKNRNTNKISKLTNGPGKLTQALQITKKHYGADLARRSELYITNGKITGTKIIAGRRIGIKTGTEKNWNFKIEI